MGDEYLHFPTTLDWVEHALAYLGAGRIGWWLHERKAKR